MENEARNSAVKVMEIVFERSNHFEYEKRGYRQFHNQELIYISNELLMKEPCRVVSGGIEFIAAAVTPCLIVDDNIYYFSDPPTVSERGREKKHACHREELNTVRLHQYTVVTHAIFTAVVHSVGWRFLWGGWICKYFNA